MNSFLDKPLDAKNLESFIVRAIKLQAYIEAISLIHTTIEVYLQDKIFRYLKENKDDGYFDKRTSTISGNGNLNSLIIWAEVTHLFDLIEGDVFADLKNFNTERNRITHSLLKKIKTYGEIKEIARKGRILQLKLSPINHSSQDIQDIMVFFDDPDKILEEDLP